MAIDVSFRDGYSTSAQDLSRFNKNFLINEGVANDGLKVSQSAVPAMSVQVTAGTSYFYGTGATADTMFEFYSDAVETVTIPTASVQARIDIVCCKVDASTGVSSLVVVSGTPSGSPVVPATPASHYKLANVAVGAGVTTITNANITDTRRIAFVTPSGDRNSSLMNGYPIPVVTGNNLTLHISTTPYNPSSPSTVTAPTPATPVWVWIDGVLRCITSATTFTVNAGTNYLNLGSSELATRAQDLFAYCQWNSTTNAVNIIASRIPIGRRMNDFVNSATNEKGAIGIVNYNATDSVVNIGRFEVTLSASASFNWSVPTYTNDTLVQHPIERTRRRSLLPTYSADGSMTWTSITTNLAEYQIIGRQVIYYISAGGTTGGTASASLRTTYPMAPFNTSNNIRGAASVRDAGNSLAGYYFLGAQANFAKPDGTNYGIGINREVWATIIYDIL